MRKMEQRVICPCGVNKQQVPHDRRICAKTHIARLRKMRALLSDVPSHQFRNLSCAFFAGPKMATAFPQLQRHDRARPTGCVICATYMPNCPSDLLIWAGSVPAYRCRNCFLQARQLCSKTLLEGKTCQVEERVVFTLCLKRLRLPRDVRRMLHRYAFPDSQICCHLAPAKRKVTE